MQFWDAFQQSGDWCKLCVDTDGTQADLSAMDLDDLFSSKPVDPLSAVAKQDLGPLSQHELDERIAALEAELVRTREHLSRAAQHRSTADDLFKR